MTDKKKSARFLRNNSGSMVIIVMMGAVVMMAVAGMMFYVKNATDSLAYIIAKGTTREMTEDLIGNILTAYSQPLEGSSCDAGLVASAVAFRDLTNQNPASYVWDSNPSNSNPPPAVNARNCILSVAAANQLERITLTITPLPTSDDLLGVSRELRIEVRLQKRGATASQAVIRHYALSLLSLDRYGVIFNTSLPEAFVVDASSRLIFDSQVLHSNRATPFNINQIVTFTGTDPLVVFKQSFNTLASRVDTKFNLELSKLNLAFEKGISTGHLANVKHFPTTYSAYSWNEPLDYRYVYPNSGSTADLSALPLLPPGKVSTNGDGHRYNQAFADILDFPNNNILQKLSETCSVGATGSASGKVMVIYRDDKEVTLDFSSESGTLKFCTMMKVKKLTVKLQKDKIHYIFGKVYFDEINVTGGGLLKVVDPELSSALSESYDAVVNMTELRRDLKTLEVYVGNPFYQPINSDLTKLHANYGHKMPSEWFSGNSQKDLAGADIPATKSVACDVAFPTDWCWPDSMHSYRRHIESSGRPNISILFDPLRPFSRTLIFNVIRTL